MLLLSNIFLLSSVVFWVKLLKVANLMFFVAILLPYLSAFCINVKFI